MATTPTTHKWTITKDLTLRSNPSTHHEYLINSCSFTDDEFYIERAKKIMDVRQVLSKVGEDPLEGLMLVDTIQRLGIDYHFKDQIEAFLKTQFMAISNNTRDHKYEDLYEVSLCFRLLRQEGYHVPADVFENFMDKEGKLEQKLEEDVRGLMALYEASQLSIEGEDILEEAANISFKLLNAMMTFLDHDQTGIVRNTLAHPYHKSLTRFMAKNFIRDMNGTNGFEKSCLELAKMDFIMVQSIHKRELFQISKWWDDLGLAKELKLARNQPLKWYLWAMVALTDPSLSEQRMELTKPISLIYIIDDIFDLYGTLDELTLFTEAVNRWDFDATKKLPNYMKICFKALYEITNEIGYKIYKAYGWNPVDSLRMTWASLCNAFLVEARWFDSGHMPKSEEYLKNGIVSSGAHVVLVHLCFLLGDFSTKESANLLNENTSIISYVATILRLWDDLGSAKDENQEGHDGSYVKCYMNEHQGTSVDIARQHVTNMISETWKHLNKECLAPNPFSSTFTKASLNLARMVSSMYSYDDNHHLPVLEECMKSMLCDGVSILGSV